MKAILIVFSLFFTFSAMATETVLECKRSRTYSVTLVKNPNGRLSAIYKSPEGIETYDRVRVEVITKDFSRSDFDVVREYADEFESLSQVIRYTIVDANSESDMYYETYIYSAFVKGETKPVLSSTYDSILGRMDCY